VSHKATNWAIEQRGLKPATKIVLWHLCDRYNPDHGCFPSQEQLAQDCEISRASLNRHLEELERRGLVAREARRDAETCKQLSTRYRLAFEEKFKPIETENPCPEMRHGNDAETVSQKDENPCLKNDESRVSNCDTNPVREPVREPVSEREGAREAQEPETATVSKDAWKRRFRKAHAEWPTYASDSATTAEAEWFKLSEKDREAAADRLGAYVFHVKHQVGRSKFCAFAVYLRDKLWKRLPVQATAGDAGQSLEAKPFGKAWGAVRFACLLDGPKGSTPKLTTAQEQMVAQGLYSRDVLLRDKRAREGWPRVNTMHERAIRRHVGVQAEASLEPLADLFGKVHRDSPAWIAWRDLHEKNGWPWFGPDRDCPEWVWMPAPPDAPETYSNPFAEVRAALARFEAEHAKLSERQAAE